MCVSKESWDSYNRTYGLSSTHFIWSINFFLPHPTQSAYFCQIRLPEITFGSHFLQNFSWFTNSFRGKKSPNSALEASHRIPIASGACCPHVVTSVLTLLSRPTVMPFFVRISHFNYMLLVSLFCIVGTKIPILISHAAFFFSVILS